MRTKKSKNCCLAGQNLTFSVRDGNNRKPLDTVYSDFFQLPPNGFGPPRFRKPLKHRLSIYLIETPRPLEKRT